MYTLWVGVYLQTEGMTHLGVGVSVDRGYVDVVGVSVDRGYVHIMGVSADRGHVHVVGVGEDSCVDRWLAGGRRVDGCVDRRLAGGRKVDRCEWPGLQ